ncbi:MAG: hypothetical protein PHF20_09195 [Halothiobacillaceae bacterium]|nr:hypothetical protein [Halothiobacillaceae bacterium]
MKIKLIYKGDFGENLRGPEMRYLCVARSLTDMGHEVTIKANKISERHLEEGIRFSPIRFTDEIKNLFNKNKYQDCTIIHGGGPWILLNALLAGFFGKKIILDNYVPHWIELDEEATHTRNSPRLLIKSSFNALRALLGSLVFDALIVANQRQLDLARGFSSPFSRTEGFDRVHIIPFGCEPYQNHSRSRGIELLNQLMQSDEKLKPSDFLVGWIGGTYGWFDLTTLLEHLMPAIQSNANIKLVFFGAGKEKQNEMLDALPTELHGNIIFLPWVPFAQRFEHWSAFDLSLVWGSRGYENDYASRTRNFDCLTLGLPILQNEDDEWGARLKSSGAGRVTDTERLADDLLQLSHDPETLRSMKGKMRELAPEFHWGRFADKLLDVAARPTMSFGRRLSGLLTFLLLIPSALVMFTYSLFSSCTKK